MGGVTGSDGGHRPRILVRMGSRRRGGQGPKTPRDRHAGCTRRHNHELMNSRKAQQKLQKLGKLVNQRRHAAHAASLEELPETARPPGPGDPMGGTETKALAKARYRSLQGAGATACLRARPTDSLRVIPAEEFVGMGRRFIGIEKHVAVRRPCCDAVDMDTRHASICPRAGAQVYISAPTARPRDVPYVEAARNSTPSEERRTVHRRPKAADEHCRQERRSPGRS